MNRLRRFFDRLSQPAVLGFAALLTALLGGLHYALDPRLSFHFAYLAPVTLAAWYTGRRGGTLVALLAAVTWFAAETFDPRGPAPFPLHPLNAVLRFAALAVVAWAFSAYRAALDHERTAARTDFLTGVLNWRAFAERTEAELRRARRYARPVTFAYIDIDDFKTVNDHYGHAVGDQLLAAVADTLESTLRTTDLVARLGGDEFAVLLPETGPEPAWIVLRKLHNAIRIRFAEEGWPASASIGAVTCLVAPNAVATIVQHADHLMYQVKRRGKGQVEHVVLADVADSNPVAAPGVQER